jgi:circadian clock protein KaiC
VIDNQGMHIREPFRGIHGILSGTPIYSYAEERQRLGGMFGSSPQKTE